MGFWAAAIPALTQMATGAAASKLGGGGAAPDQLAGGAGGTITGKAKSPPIIGAPVGGTLAGDALRDMLKVGAKTATDAVFSPLQAKISGRANRASLDASFPELNAWEKSGASATQGGQKISDANSASVMQSREHRNQQKLQRQNLSTQERMQKRQIEASTAMNQVSSQATVTSASLSSQASRALQQWNEKLIGAQIGKVASETSLTGQKSYAQYMANVQSKVSSMQTVIQRLSNGDITPQQAARDAGVIIAGEAASSAGQAAQLVAGGKILKHLLKGTLKNFRLPVKKTPPSPSAPGPRQITKQPLPLAKP